MAANLPATGRDRFDDEFAELFALGYRVAYRILGSRDEAKDAAQEHWPAPSSAGTA
jgi:DNA-directed RNA polymerase specialized sigma24 family protein